MNKRDARVQDRRSKYSLCHCQGTHRAGPHWLPVGRPSPPRPAPPGAAPARMMQPPFQMRARPPRSVFQPCSWLLAKFVVSFE